MAPSDHLDGMATHHLPRHVLVRPVLVRCEVLVDREAYHQWAIGVQLTLDLLVVRENLQRA